MEDSSPAKRKKMESFNLKPEDFASPEIFSPIKTPVLLNSRDLGLWGSERDEAFNLKEELKGDPFCGIRYLPGSCSDYFAWIDHVKGYAAKTSIQLSCLIRVKRDYYSGIRACLFGMLCLWDNNRGEPKFRALSPSVVENFTMQNSWLKTWEGGRALSKLSKNLERLEGAYFHFMKPSKTREDEVVRVYDYFNDDGDVEMMEAVKFHLLWEATRCHYQLNCGGVPDPKIPDWIMGELFARERGKTPEEYWKNFLEDFGKRKALESVDFKLLSRVLGIQIQIFHVSKSGDLIDVKLIAGFENQEGWNPILVNLCTYDFKSFHLML